jgi:Cdc6-like AAA superfamily ATPase
MIDDFIIQIKAFTSVISNSKQIIKNPEKLISALKELNDIIGLEKVKERIISQIKCICVDFLLREVVVNSESNFLHMVFSGPPGIGKTSLAHIICKIWSALGILKAPKKKNKKLSIIDKIIKKLPVVPKLPLSPKNKDEEAFNKEITLLEKNLSEASINIKNMIQKIDDCILLDKNLRVLNKLKETKDLINETTDSINKSRSIATSIPLLYGNFPDSPSLPPIPSIEQEEEIVYKVYKRSDLIGQFLGETAIKTQKALEEGLGGVILIDEAYELYTSSEREDMYGMECLSTINQFMSLHASEIIIIFVGYMDLLSKTIFRVQPGLRRRIGWVFEFEPYTSEEIKDIFIKQFSKKEDWKIEDNDTLKDFFNKNIDKFPNYGGDTQRLVYIIKRIHSEKVFDSILQSKEFKFTIPISTLEEGLKELTLANDKVNLQDTEDKPPPFMYS